MGNKAFFCRYPEDPENCRQTLTRTWRKGALGQHCIMEGLKANWPRCRQVLVEGLYNKASAHKGSMKPAKTGSESNELSEACKAVVLLGYPLEIETLKEVLYGAYYRLVRSAIYKFGIRDDNVTSADDVFQSIFLNLHKQFQKSASVNGPLAGYIWRVTINECIRAKSASRKQVSLEAGDLIGQHDSFTAVFVPPEVVENWEYLDRKLFKSEQGNLVNRVILAQQCIEACSTGRKPSAKELKAAWQNLKQMSEADVASLHRETIKQIKQSPETNVVDIAAKLINSGLAEPYQVAIVLASGTGIDLNRTYELTRQLCSLSDTAIYARICRIYRVLRPPGMEEKE